MAQKARKKIGPFSALLPFSGPFHIIFIANQALKSGSEG